jgi:sarcosine oxidase subunit alpha
MVRDDAIRLMGFRPVDRTQKLIAGAHFITKGEEANMDNDQGWMTSVAWSPSLGHSIGLGFIKRGHERQGEIVRAVSPVHGTEMEVEIVSAHFIDPEGERLRG